MKKTLGLILIVMLAVAGPLAAQGASEKASTPEVYFLNFKPEIATVYTDTVAPAFEAETGIKLKVVTAASNQYATTLKSEMATSNPPVIFQTNGPVGLQGSRTDVAPLENTEFYKILADKSMALSIDGHVAAIPYAVEGYGIIYNQAIMNKYFATAGAKATSMDQIKDFATLKAVVEDMTAKKSQLGIKGVFASTSMAPGNDWRWQTHLFNVPLYQEFADKSSPGRDADRPRRQNVRFYVRRPVQATVRSLSEQQHDRTRSCRKQERRRFHGRVRPRTGGDGSERQLGSLADPRGAGQQGRRQRHQVHASVHGASR